LHRPKFFSDFGPPAANAELDMVVLVATTAVTKASATTMANIASVVLVVCEFMNTLYKINCIKIAWHDIILGTGQ
jgi:hypothetical protein